MKRPIKTPWYLVAALGAVCALSIAAVPGDVAFAATKAKPVVDSVFADPYRVPASAKPVVSTVVIGQVRHASTCYLTVVKQSSPTPTIVKRLPATKSCVKGDYRGQVDLYNNPTTHERWVELLLHASSATGVFTGKFYITQYAGSGAPTVTPSTTTTTTTAPFRPPNNPTTTTTTPLPVPCTEGCATPTTFATPPTTVAPTSTTVAPTTTSTAGETTTTEVVTTTTSAPPTTVPPVTTTTVPPTTTTTKKPCPTTVPPCPPKHGRW